MCWGGGGGVQAIEEGLDTSVCLLNYRADGTKFWNQFFVASLRDGGGVTVNNVGVQCKVRRQMWSLFWWFLDLYQYVRQCSDKVFWFL